MRRGSPPRPWRIGWSCSKHRAGRASGRLLFRPEQQGLSALSRGPSGPVPGGRSVQRCDQWGRHQGATGKDDVLAASVDRSTVTAVVEAATLAPSVHNTQPWRFVVGDSAESPGTIELYA